MKTFKIDEINTKLSEIDSILDENYNCFCHSNDGENPNLDFIFLFE